MLPQQSFDQNIHEIEKYQKLEQQVYKNPYYIKFKHLTYIPSRMFYNFTFLYLMEQNISNIFTIYISKKF